MIALDTSALMAIVLDEPDADLYRSVLRQADAFLISAGTLSETLIVASRRDVSASMKALRDGLACQVVPVDERVSRRMEQAYRRWGKGNHPARLNSGDCFAYDVATEYACPLLFVGKDFSQTDIQPATTAA